MKGLSIKLLSLEDADKLFEFEIKNRQYFKRIDLPRNTAYYDRDSFQKILEELIQEQQMNQHYMYLVLNEQEEVIGRINLTEVAGEPLRKAELGYRIGEQHQGKGIATAAIELVLKQASELHHLHRIEAGTSPHNLGSQVVLRKNGFRFVGKYNQYIFQANGWTDSMLFEKILD